MLQDLEVPVYYLEQVKVRKRDTISQCEIPKNASYIKHLHHANVVSVGSSTAPLSVRRQIGPRTNVEHGPLIVQRRNNNTHKRATFL